MAKTLTANRAQVRAARLIVKRAQRGIGQASPAVRAIAAAKPAQATRGATRDRSSSAQRGA